MAAAQPLPDYPYKGLLLDVSLGGSFPAADSRYGQLADPTLKTALHFGWELIVEQRFLIAPELTLDYVPINSDDNQFQRLGLDARFHRVRLLGGVRFLVRFGLGDLFFRVALGLDHIDGPIAALGARTSWKSSAFGFEPGVGAQFTVVKHLMLGIMVSFPVAKHDFGNQPGTPGAFTAVDVDLVGFAGFRY